MTLRQHSTRRGFTLMELLVAVSLLSLMLFLINRLFMDTSAAVSTGVRASGVLASARAVGDQIKRDASAMVGPDATNPVDQGGGYLVIINKRFDAPVRKRDGQLVTESFRVDQIAFVASTQTNSSQVPRFRAAAPRNANQFGSDFESSYALIRYGHALRTNPDGTDTGVAELGNANAGLDEIANEWILARQTILMNPSDSAGNPLQAATDWYANYPANSEPVNIAGGILANGYCDVALSTPKEFVDTAFNGNSPYLVPIATQNANYLNTTFANDRLRVNPLPAGNAPDFSALKVGQLHGVFAPNCSDFIVQFAADVNGDGEIDRSDNNTPGITTDDYIIWYDMDNIADLLAINPDWAGGSSVNSPYFNLSGVNHGDHAFIFRYDDDQSHNGTVDPTNSKWPYLIRIRYRLHDAPGKLESNASFRVQDGIDQDGDGVGLLATSDDDEALVAGQYFEQIIRVPRP